MVEATGHKVVVVGGATYTLQGSGRSRINERTSKRGLVETWIILYSGEREEKAQVQ